MSDLDSKARAILFEALKERSPAEFGAFVDQACGKDKGLRARVEALLEEYRESGELLEKTSGYEPTEEFAVTHDAGKKIGPYKLLQKIGEGGMGVVFMAEQTEPVKRRVALKIIKPGMDSRQVVARFEAERQALAMMDHPNISRVLDAGATDTGLPYFVMELVKGIPITKYCDQKNLSTLERLELFVPICAAVQHAHLKGIIHRDLKPSNVLVALYDGRPVPKVIDFGVAKAISQQLTEKTMFTQYGQIVGTVDYMSPEQAELNQLDIDTRSDIYSLGVLLYELLTGDTPFDRKRLRSAAIGELLRIIREEEPPKPSTKLSSGDTLPSVAANRRIEPQKLSALVRGELDWIVMKAMEKDRSRRYETANGLAMDVQRFLRNEPVAACPPSSAYRLRKFIRRNRAGVVAAALVAGALLVGIAGTTWGMVWALNERARVAAQAESASASIREANDIVIKTFDELAREFHDKTPRQLPINDAAEFRGMEVDALGIASKNLAVFLSRALKDEARSRLAAEQTTAELTQVVEFQAEQLGGVDVPLMATRLRADLLEKVRATAKLARLDPEAIEARAAEVERLVAGADFTGMALETLEENVFRRALNAINTQFADQPLTKGRLLQTVATTARDLGLLNLATEPQEEALKIRRLKLGNEHPSTLDSIHNKARLLHVQRKSEKAEPLFREALAGRRALLGDDHPDTLRSVNWMGNCLSHQAKLDEAEPFLREALKGRRRILGDDHPNTLESFNDLGILLKLQDRFEEAKQNYEMAINGLRRVLGDDHPWTLTSLYNMGRLLRDADEFEEAEEYFREAAEGRRRVLGGDHLGALTAIFWMGTVLRDQGKFDRAEAYYMEALEGRRRVLGEDHPDTLLTTKWLMHILEQQKKYAESEPFHRVMLKAKRRASGEDSVEVLAELGALGQSLVKQSKFADAEPFYRESLEIRQRAAGADDPATLMANVWLAHVLQRQGKLKDSATHYQKALEGQRRVLGPKHKHTLTTAWGLGRTLVGLKRYEEAEQVLLECQEGRQEILEPGHWHLFNTQSLLGASIAGQGGFAKAEPMLIEAYEKMRPPAASAYYSTEALQRVIDLYDAWHASDPKSGHDAKAAEWKKKLNAARKALGEDQPAATPPTESDPK